MATSVINHISIGHTFRSHPVMPCAASTVHARTRLSMGKGRQVRKLMHACRSWKQLSVYALVLARGVCALESSSLYPGIEANIS